MNKNITKNIIEELDYDDLINLREEINKGSLIKEIESKIRNIENPSLICPVCERPVDEDKDILLIFGPKDFRQKARFCGNDCLKFFINQRFK